LIALTIGLCIAGCHARTSPARLEQQIQQEIHHGDLSVALRDADRAYKEYATKNIEWAWHFRVLKAQVLATQSDYKGTLALLNEDLPPALTSTDVAVQKEVFTGMAHASGQQYSMAEKDFEKAERIARRLRPNFLCQVLLARAALEVNEKKFANAEVDYKDALAIARQQKLSNPEATALSGLGWLATSREHYDESIDWNQAALQLSRSLGLKSTTSTILGNIAWNYLKLADFEAALDFFKQSAEESERAGLTGNIAYWFTGIANAEMALHDYQAAEAVAKQTLERSRRIDTPQTIAVCLNTLAELTLRTGRLEEAENYNREALKLEDNGADHFGVLDSLILSGRIEAKKGHYAEAEKIFRRVLDDPGTEAAVRWGVQARLAELDDAKGLPSKTEQEYRNSIQTFEAARSSISRDELRLSFLAGAIELYDDYVDFLLRRGRSEDALMVAELSRAQTLEEGLAGGTEAAGIANRNVRSHELARRLKATLLFYWVGEKHSYVWVITPVKTTCLPLPAESGIDPIVKSYGRTLLDLRDPLETGNPDGRKLYEMLLEPAKDLIPQGSRVILLPDGSLYGLNFETLIVPGPKPHYWIEDVTLTTASSLTLLASAAARPAPKEKNMFLVGDTVSPNADFPALPQAAAEMQSIEKYFPEPRRAVLSGGAATPAAYLSSKPEQYAYLHFVTHGTASRARPLESAVVLSKEKDEDSYKLYARDIVKRRLSASLVTISACTGAGTRAFSGEGLVGLSWAFLRAGAHNVIGALWEVSDTATPELMDKLYDGLSRGQDPASALRAAKLSLLHQDSVYKKPRYWAPFQLYAGS
jgi:CHAT domain-containing protein/tetratricopeptide (TPR) repeat protein